MGEIVFRPLATEERDRLLRSLRKNAELGTPIELSPKDTSFLGGDGAALTDEAVINQIKSVPCHYSDELVEIAKELLRDNPEYLVDARQGSPLGNSVVGSLLNLQHGAPRQYAEQAVIRAMQIMDKESAKSETQVTLPRTGDTPLTFSGELVADSDGQYAAGQNKNRWHELAVYRTTGGKYVVAIKYRTIWQGELDHDFAAVASDPKEAATLLREYDPTTYVVGYPIGEAYAEKQDRLMRDLTMRYQSQVSEVLSPAEFSEVVE